MAVSSRYKIAVRSQISSFVAENGSHVVPMYRQCLEHLWSHPRGHRDRYKTPIFAKNTKIPIRQFSLSIFTGNRANFLGSYLKKYSEIKKSESTFFYYFFILYNFVIEHLASKSILTNFLFFFFFFAFEIVFLRGFRKSVSCAQTNFQNY